MANKLTAGIDYIGIATPFYCNDGNGNFLLHKRGPANRDERGHWDFGSGQLEFGEEVEKNVLREVKEEYGCHGTIQEILPAHSILRKFGKTKTHWLVIPFFIKINPKSVRIKESDKVTQVGWYSLKNLPRPLHTGVKKTLKRYKRFFRRYRLTRMP